MDENIRHLYLEKLVKKVDFKREMGYIKVIFYITGQFKNSSYHYNHNRYGNFSAFLMKYVL